MRGRQAVRHFDDCAEFDGSEFPFVVPKTIERPAALMTFVL